MAILHSITNGNFTSASTWGVVNATSYLDSRATSTTLTTSAVASPTFIPGAITISGVSIQILGRSTTPTGTITLQLFNSTSSTVITSVVLNISDLPNTTNQATLYLGWTYFRFASNQLLVAGNSYSIRLLTSVAAQVSVYRDATANNWSRALITTTTAAPAATDTLITGGDFISAGVNTTTTITMNSTTTTQYGQCYIGSNGIFNYGVSASTNYVLRLAGDVWIGRSGTFTIGTITNPIPATSTAILEINCASALQFQIYNFGTFETKYATTVLHRALLNADIAVGATTMTTNVSTGWKQNDVIVIPSTTRTTTQHERVTLNVDASGTTLTHGTTSFAHDGNAAIYIQADLANLTRSIKIRSVSGTFKTRFQQGLNGVTTFFDVEFFEMGGFIHNSGSGLNAGTFNTQQCTFWQTTSPGTTTIFLYLNTSTYTLSNNVFYNYADFFGSVTDNNLIIGFTGFGAMGAGSLGSNNVISSSQNAGLSGVALVNGSTGNRFYATGGNGAIYNTTTGFNNTVSNYVFFNNSVAIRFLSVTAGSDRTPFEKFENCYFYGNVTTIDSGSFRKLQFNNCFFWGGKTGLITAIGYSPMFNDYIHFSDCTFGRRPDGVDSLFSTSCLRGGQVGTTLTNCLFFGIQASHGGASTFTSVNGFNGVTSLKNNQTTNEYRQFQANGFIQNDTVITYNGLPTIRITPVIATNKTFSDPVRVAVKSGQTCTIFVVVRKSITGDGTVYNGNQPRLMYAFNPLAGNLTETVATKTNNILNYPQNFDNAYWTKVSTTILPLQVANPFLSGGLADKISFAADSLARVERQNVSIVIGQQYTYSVWLRADSNMTLNLIMTNTQVVNVTTSWQRFSITITASSGGTTPQIRNSSATAKDFYMWGAQLVIGPTPLTYYDNGDWEILSYTTPAVSNDCVLEFYIDCDGTTGWINIDDFKTTTSNDTRGMNYWSSVGVYSEPDWRRPGGAVTFVN